MLHFNTELLSLASHIVKLKNLIYVVPESTICTQHSSGTKVNICMHLVAKGASFEYTELPCLVHERLT